MSLAKSTDLWGSAITTGAIPSTGSVPVTPTDPPSQEGGRPPASPACCPCWTEANSARARREDTADAQIATRLANGGQKS